MKENRFFFKLGEISIRDVRYELGSRGITHDLRSNSSSDYLIGYPDPAVPKVYSNHRVYDPKPNQYDDYAFEDLWDFVESMDKRMALGNSLLRGSQWRAVYDWPFTGSYNSCKINKPEKQTMANNHFSTDGRPVLYNIAAVFYPEYPEGAVVDIEKAEYPKVVLKPTTVLARNEQEAVTRASGKVEEGYLDRQDGTVRFFISPF